LGDSLISMAAMINMLVWKIIYFGQPKVALKLN
jgi:hypothetical protein